MTRSQAFTKRSPVQIRQLAAAVMRNRRRLELANQVLMVRAPEAGETPLSAQEIAVGVQQGLVRTRIVGARWSGL